MTKHNFTALDLFIIEDTLYQSLRISNYSGRGTVEGRQQVLEKICGIMVDMNVEILTGDGTIDELEQGITQHPRDGL